MRPAVELADHRPEPADHRVDLRVLRAQGPEDAHDVLVLGAGLVGLGATGARLELGPLDGLGDRRADVAQLFCGQQLRELDPAVGLVVAGQIGLDGQHHGTCSPRAARAATIRLYSSRYPGRSTPDGML